MMKIFFSIFLILLAILTGFEECFAQQQSTTRGDPSLKGLSEGRTIDSLLHVLETAKEDSNKVNILIKLSQEYCYTNIETSKNYVEQGLALAKASNFKPGIADALNTLGIINILQGNYDNAIELLLKSKQIHEALGNKKGVASIFGNIGSVYQAQGNYEKAIEYHFKCLRIDEELEDTVGMATTFNNIGIVNYFQRNYNKAQEYYTKALKINEELGRESEAASNITNIAIIYEIEGNSEKALEYYLKALKINEKAGNKRGAANSLGGVGEVYRDQGDYEKAKEYYLRSINLKEQLGDRFGYAAGMADLALVYYKLGDYESSIDYDKKSLKIGREIGAKEIVKEAYKDLSKVYAALNKHREAYEYHQKYMIAKDSIYNQEKSKQIEELQTKYETGKKEKEIALLNKDNELKAIQLAKKEEEAKKQKIIILSIIGILVLSVAFAFVLYNRFRVIRTQKNIIEIQKKTVDEKNSDMNASIRYASRIQDAILTSDEFLNNALNQHFVLYKPKDVVSGDFYWAYQTKTIVIWAAVDCTGHGVPGAFMSMIGNSLLNEIVIDQRITKADKILNELRAAIIKTLGQTGQEGEARDGMDIALCVWDKANNKLEFAGANNPLYLIRSTNKSPFFEGGKSAKGGQGDVDAPGTNVPKKKVAFSKQPAVDIPRPFGTPPSEEGGLIEIRGDKQPIGYEKGKDNPFTKHEIQLEQGDTIYIFSDGYQDQFGGPKGKKFRPKQFRELLLSIQDKPMDEQKKILDERIENWKGGGEQVDDILVIGVRV